MDTITSQSASSLVRLIAERKLSVGEVVEAHIERIQEVNPSINAMVFEQFKQARQLSGEADRKVRTGEELGPLHGLPVTIKEMFDVANAPTTIGISTRANHRAKRDAIVVSRLKKAGAIVLGKTNVPLLGMKISSDNPLYGETSNPWNLERSAGGSSGGEAALIAACGSPLGLGSDGGGSIRQPCHSCGIMGFKPTGRRLSLEGHWSTPNWIGHWAQPGPIARHVEDLALAYSVLTKETRIDLEECPENFAESRIRPIDESQRPRIGVYTQLGDLKPCPSVIRVINEAKQALEREGFEVIDFEFPDADDAWGIYLGIFYADGLASMKEAMRGAKSDEAINQSFTLTKIPNLLRPLIVKAYSLFGQETISRAFRHLRKKRLDAHELFALRDKEQAYRKRFTQALDAANFDVLLGPPNTSAAFPKDSFNANFSLQYTGIYNLLGLPAGVVAAGTVRPEETSCTESSRDAVVNCLHDAQSNSVGLPVAVHVATRWWREDLLLSIMQWLESHFRNQPDFPRCPPEIKSKP